MAAIGKIEDRSVMASRWRRRRMCVLVAEQPAPAALREICATGAFLETNARPALASSVELHHPDAGAIAASVQSHASEGIRITFPCSERSMAFALAAIVADMSRPAF